MQVLARDEPKRGVRRVDNLEQKRAEWRQVAEVTKQWLRDWDIDPQQAYQTWWSQSGSKLKTDRKFDNRRNVVRQLGVKIRG